MNFQLFVIAYLKFSRIFIYNNNYENLSTILSTIRNFNNEIDNKEI